MTADRDVIEMVSTFLSAVTSHHSSGAFLLTHKSHVCIASYQSPWQAKSQMTRIRWR